MDRYSDIKKTIKNIPEDKKPYAKKLLDELVFMGATLESLKRDISSRGVVVDSIGSTGQEVTKSNPSLQNYNALIKNYNSTIKQIADLLPDGNDGTDALLEFVK